MVNVDTLSCLDFLLWLRTGEAAAAKLQVAQSTICRQARKAASQLGLTTYKEQSEWFLSGDTTLLNLEREVHQEYRWRKNLPLRLEAQYYSGPLYCNGQSNLWISGNFNFLEIQTPLMHLRDGVIDAWIGCHPDVPEAEDADLCCFPLTRLPVHLVVAHDHPLSRHDGPLTLRDLQAFPSLALPDGAFPKVQACLQALGLWNSASSIRRYDHSQWEGRIATDLVVGYATVFSEHLFDRPQVRLPVQVPLTVGDTLVVKRRYGDHPRLQALLTRLQTRACQLAASHPEVKLAFSASEQPAPEEPQPSQAQLAKAPPAPPRP
ncbi:MAG: LysR substrate-binding domain-containing protein [Synechococcaceae cyanobacterium]|nr:LysR substrate-binding domain-containing protein [Synechococcaceae cyanobacterium]